MTTRGSAIAEVCVVFCLLLVTSPSMTVLGLANRSSQHIAGVSRKRLVVLATYRAAVAISIDVVPDFTGPLYYNQIEVEEFQ
jgi:hypothetical protein